MLPDRVSNPGPLTYESCALPIAIRGPARVDSVYLTLVKARLNGFTHVLYQWRAYKTIYTIHVPILCKILVESEIFA